MFHSVQMLYFREEDCSLHLVSRDFNTRIVTKTDVLVDGTKVGILAADDLENIQIFQQNSR